MPAKKSNTVLCSLESVGSIFQQVHRSAAHAQKYKKELIALGEAHPQEFREAMCSVMLLILKQVPQITADALKRHYAFLAEVCKGLKETVHSDGITVEILKCFLPLHNANEKTVRLAVVSTFKTLLKLVDQSNTSEERQDLYQDIAEALKKRVHDKWAPVREMAVASVAAFQTGKKDCDVTQQLLVLLCTDTNADVRRQILRCVVPRKEFLEGYFHGMVRCTRDVVARVRSEAWDALGRFPWRYIMAYANAKNVKMADRISDGLNDSNASVCIACRAALLNCWLQRDYKAECAALLELMMGGCNSLSLDPFEVVGTELLRYCQRRDPAQRFEINLADIHAPGLLMWKIDCKARCDSDAGDETSLLLSLEQFSAVLQDTVYAYARPDVEPKTVRFRNIEDAENMLRILLSVFDIYEESGYLAHADNNTRTSLLRIINFILKVVPDDDPGLFVDAAVRALKFLTTRTPEEASTTITSALDSLFRSLKLPQRHGLGFDDVEALGRKSRERQQDLARMKALIRAGTATQEEFDHLHEAIDRDEKFLLRMQLMVLAFLSHSQRGDDIPIFCSQMIRLGRQLDNEAVRVAATKALALQCLISPNAVHTFMPLILSETSEPVRNDFTSVPLAAIGVAFDLVMEYGLRFFDTTKRPSNLNPATLFNSENAIDVRLQHEQALAEENVHKVGGANLLSTLRYYLCPSQKPKNAITLVGFCKLLSCNRIPQDAITGVMAELLLHHVRARITQHQNTTSAFIVDYLTKFLRSFSSSHPKQQERFAKGGVAAFRVLLLREPSWAAKVIQFVLKLSDPFTLCQIRDIDPETAHRVNKELSEANPNPNNPSEDNGGRNKNHDGNESVNNHARNSSIRTNAARSSMQSGRLLRELSRYSLHETIAEELLIELALSTNTESRQVCMDALEKHMYFYSKENQPFLLYCAREAVRAVPEGEDERARLQGWVSELEQRYFDVEPAVAVENEGNMHEEKLAERKAGREVLLNDLVERGYAEVDCVPPQGNRTPASVKVKVEDQDRKRDRELDFFEIDTILGSRRKVKS
ncbi:unnamed protein product [Phytomonas sp. EM1]|nr:unnamed protein product [Phytomonas sp. EM1]|eukprot:CCW59749.1 unnamed protein product [Phytomonas sp. isolate EM1]